MNISDEGAKPIIVRLAIPMPLYIRDDATAALVSGSAKQRGLTRQDAVRLAVMAENDRAKYEKPLPERIGAWREANPFTAPTGLKADKAFFDDLSGEPSFLLTR